MRNLIFRDAFGWLAVQEALFVFLPARAVQSVLHYRLPLYEPHEYLQNPRSEIRSRKMRKNRLNFEHVQKFFSKIRWSKMAGISSGAYFMQNFKNYKKDVELGRIFLLFIEKVLSAEIRSFKIWCR